jgi:type IV pilus assembly protein PilQ
VNIKNIRFKANDNGGTVMVDGDGPLTFNTRTNPETNQFIIEIPSSNLPRKLKRPFNTRDMAGIVGSIDAYQNSGSTTSRIVIQLRPGAPEPVVQSEGNSLLVVAGGAPSEEPDTQATPQETADVAPVSQEAESTSILSAQSLEEFLSGNMQFYGKPISIETSGMEIREVFKFLSEESGINMVLGDEVKGQISLKLRQVPWDQAFVLVMRAKKLGYTRTGNVIRVAAVADIRAEEDEVVRLANAKKNQTPLSVRVIPISYAKVEEMTRQIQPFLSERGKIAADSRTSSLVISDLDENIERAQKLIQAIDVPPPQVLIEGKVVEASDTFQRSIGVRWGASGQTFGSGRTRGNLNFDINPGITKQTLGINFSLGTLDILGNLTSSLALFEDQNEIKVLSSPRIVALHNENATINQTTEIPIVTTAAQSGGAAATTTVSFKPVKLAMTVTPQVTNDGAVIMTVDVNRDSLGARAEGGTNAQAVNTRGAKTKVLVRNGQTAVIGGIYQNDANVSEAKVPWLGDIPVVGWLFKSRSTNTAKNELLIFLTPRIISNADSMGSDSGGTDL